MAIINFHTGRGTNSPIQNYSYQDDFIPHHKHKEEWVQALGAAISEFVWVDNCERYL